MNANLITNVKDNGINENGNQTFLMDTTLISDPSEKMLTNAKSGKTYRMATVNGPKGPVSARVPSVVVASNPTIAKGDKVTVSATLDTENTVTWYQVIGLAGGGVDAELHDFASMVEETSETAAIQADVVEEVA